DVTKGGIYNLAYNVTDGSGNVAITKQVRVVVKDQIPPVVRLRGLEEMDMEVFSTFNDPGIEMSDESGYVIEKPRVHTLNPNIVGTYHITYTACDGASNCVSVVRTINVVDRTAPKIQLIGRDPLIWPRFREYVDPGVTVIDNYDAPSMFDVT